MLIESKGSLPTNYMHAVSEIKRLTNENEQIKKLAQDKDDQIKKLEKDKQIKKLEKDKD